MDGWFACYSRYRNAHVCFMCMCDRILLGPSTPPRYTLSHPFSFPPSPPQVRCVTRCAQHPLTVHACPHRTRRTRVCVVPAHPCVCRSTRRSHIVCVCACIPVAHVCVPHMFTCCPRLPQLCRPMTSSPTPSMSNNSIIAHTSTQSHQHQHQSHTHIVTEPSRSHTSNSISHSGYIPYVRMRKMVRMGITCMHADGWNMML